MLVRIVLFLILILVSESEIERKKFFLLSRSTRLEETKSHSRLKSWKKLLGPLGPAINVNM